MSEQVKYISLDNIQTIWNAAKEKFVAKEDGKGLSSNDFTDEEKEVIAAALLHMEDTSIHLTNEERERLNTRVTAYRNASGALVLSFGDQPDE